MQQEYKHNYDRQLNIYKIVHIKDYKYTFIMNKVSKYFKTTYYIWKYITQTIILERRKRRQREEENRRNKKESLRKN